MGSSPALPYGILVCVICLSLQTCQSNATIVAGAIAEAALPAITDITDTISNAISDTTDRISTAVDTASALPATVADSISTSIGDISAAMIAPIETMIEGKQKLITDVGDIFIIPSSDDAGTSSDDDADYDYGDYEASETRRRPRRARFAEKVRGGPNMKRIRVKKKKVTKSTRRSQNKETRRQTSPLLFGRRMLAQDIA